MRAILLVGFGGFLGSVARYCISLNFRAPFLQLFPWATLLINLTGCFVLGAIIGSRLFILESNQNHFFVYGFLGAFTTFSTFSAETFMLFNMREYVFATVNIITSIVGGLAAFASGQLLVRHLTL